jgi:hypothetical protein
VIDCGSRRATARSRSRTLAWRSDDVLESVRPPTEGLCAQATPMCLWLHPRRRPVRARALPADGGGAVPWLRNGAPRGRGCERSRLGALRGGSWFDSEARATVSGSARAVASPRTRRYAAQVRRAGAPRTSPSRAAARETSRHTSSPRPRRAIDRRPPRESNARRRFHEGRRCPVGGHLPRRGPPTPPWAFVRRGRSPYREWGATFLRFRNRRLGSVSATSHAFPRTGFPDAMPRVGEPATYLDQASRVVPHGARAFISRFGFAPALWSDSASEPTLFSLWRVERLKGMLAEVARPRFPSVVVGTTPSACFRVKLPLEADLRCLSTATSLRRRRRAVRLRTSPSLS